MSPCQLVGMSVVVWALDHLKARADVPRIEGFSQTFGLVADNPNGHFCRPTFYGLRHLESTWRRGQLSMLQATGSRPELKRRRKLTEGKRPFRPSRDLRTYQLQRRQLMHTPEERYTHEDTSKYCWQGRHTPFRPYGRKLTTIPPIRRMISSTVPAGADTPSTLSLSVVKQLLADRQVNSSAFLLTGSTSR